MYYKPGQAVRVNKDITRVKEWQLVDAFPYPMNSPVYEEYAKEGDTGVILEVFRPQPTAAGKIKPLSAKVRINDQIKTFRLTSLDHVK